MEFQFVDGLRVHGDSVGASLHLKDSPFWTLTPSYSQNIHIHDLRITAPMDRIGAPQWTRPAPSLLPWVHGSGLRAELMGTLRRRRRRRRQRRTW